MFCERRQSPFFNGFFGIWDQSVQIHFAHLAQAVALRTGPFWGVERKRIGFRIRGSFARRGAHEVPAIGNKLVAGQVQNANGAFSVLHAQLQRLAQAVRFVRFHHQAVNDHLDVVGFVAVQFHAAGNLHQNAVDARPQKPLFGHAFKQFAVVAFAGTHHGRQNRYGFAVLSFQYAIQNFRIRIAHHSFSRSLGIGGRGAGVEQAQEIVYFSNRSYRRAGVSVGGLLLNRNDGTQSFDGVHVRTFQIAHELTCIGGKGFHIPTLAFRVQGVEC